MSHRDFDIVIFGFTGFTGYYIARELTLSLQQKSIQDGLQLKWAVAGRELAKMEASLRKLSRELGLTLFDTPKVVADVRNPYSLNSLATRTRVLINAVGPYELWGKPVAQACVQSGTNLVDLSGELTYIEEIHLLLDTEASNSNTLIIPCCGWDSIPCDVGVDLLKQQFGGKLHSVDSFMAVHPGTQGYVINHGTFDSISNFMGDYQKFQRIHKQLYQKLLNKPLPKSRINQPRRLLPFRFAGLSGFNFLFLETDQRVVERTNYANYVQHNERPVQINCYFNVQSLLSLVGILLILLNMVLFSIFGVTRALLQAFPSLFTAGLVTKRGMTRTQIQNTTFTLHLFGRGWRNTSHQPSDATNEPHFEPLGQFDLERTLRVSGPDPGYLTASICVVHSALTILEERDKMPRGGVLTPAFAFRQTNLVARLRERGIKFEYI